MQIVVDISEKDYLYCKKHCLPSCDDRILRKYFYEMVANGTPLPKGHGDLIDRGELKTHFIGTEQGTDLEVYLEPTIINAPPIIKADRAESEE